MGISCYIGNFLKRNSTIVFLLRFKNYYSPPKVAGIGQSNQARMCSLAAESVIDDCKLGKAWNAVSMSAAIGNSYPTVEQYNKGMHATFIEPRDGDSMEFEEDPDHVVGAERDLAIDSENLDEF